MPKVYHCKKNKNAIYVGRSDSLYHFGNPFSHIKQSAAKVIVGSRDEACDRFISWLDGTSDHDVEPKRREWILNNLWRLKGEDLSCWCVPERCHAETLIKLAN